VNSGVQQARRLVEYSDGHPVISLYLDLDPERFATPPARASQIRSLIDQASREVESDDQLDHSDRVSLRDDLRRVDEFLRSPEAPFKGARALAVFCSSQDRLFETIQLTRPVPGRVVIDKHPYVEPMLTALQERRWLVALVNRRLGWLLAGAPDDLTEKERRLDEVHGQHDQGGWSQARYERHVDKEVDDHLHNFADIVNRRWRAERFDRLAAGGPQEIVPRFLELLGEDVRSHLAPGRLDVDLSDATDAQVMRAVEGLVEEDGRRTEHEALVRLRDAVGAGGKGTEGVDDTVRALNERRVAQLLMEPGFDGQGQRCPTCGLLLTGQEDQCPAEGSTLERVEHLREAVVEAALAQDAGVLVVRFHDDLQRVGGLGALLRF
jgi:peptide subunit release factor 1 (eRF1)